jgi:catechol 2,3-dioxygenase-like lactoylglutathione lyase family enzyme
VQLLTFPGIQLLLTEGDPVASSGDTSANHIAFSVRSHEDYRNRLRAVSAAFVIDNEDAGQILADLPDGVRVEFLVDENQAEPIVFHHLHLSANELEPLRNWYLDVFGAQAGERNGMPSALLPGGRVDLISARGGEPLPTEGAAIDHIGFSVQDLDAFVADLQRRGIGTEGEGSLPAGNLRALFLTDPVGTRIAVTEELPGAD